MVTTKTLITFNTKQHNRVQIQVLPMLCSMSVQPWIVNIIKLFIIMVRFCEGGRYQSIRVNQKRCVVQSANFKLEIHTNSAFKINNLGNRYQDYTSFGALWRNQ